MWMHIRESIAIYRIYIIIIFVFTGVFNLMSISHAVMLTVVILLYHLSPTMTSIHLLYYLRQFYFFVITV